MRYIEQNPLKAKMVSKIQDYPYSSSFYFFKSIIPKNLQNSWIVKTYKNTKDIESFFIDEIDYEDLKELKKASSLVEASDINCKLDEKILIESFKKTTNKNERNKKIVEAYNQGYSQYIIAKVIKISQPAVNRIIKRNNAIEETLYLNSIPNMANSIQTSLNSSDDEFSEDIKW